MTLYRYIISKHILPFIYSFVVIMFVLVMQLVADLLQRILAKDLDPLIVAEVFLCSLGWMVVLAVPMAVLVATLQAFGGMSADNEITAIKASGRNLFYLLTPVINAAMVLAALLIFFNNTIYPEANHRAAKLLADISRKRPVTLIEPNVLIREFPNYAIRVKAVNNRTGELFGIIIFSEDPREDPATTVATRGTVQTTRDGKYLELTLFDGETHRLSRRNEGEYFIGRFARQVIFINNIDSEFHRSETEFRSDREMSADELLAEVTQFRQRRTSAAAELNAQIDSLLASCRRMDSLALAVVPDTTHRQSDSSFTHWMAGVTSTPQRRSAISTVRRTERTTDRVERTMDREERRIAQYMVEVHKKYALPIACIIFVLIGAPLGIMARRGGMGTGVAYSVVFFVIYWVFLIGGESLADRLVISPAVAMWSANVIIGIFGIVLVLRMIRETTFISFGWLARIWQGISQNRALARVVRAEDSLLHALFSIPVWVLNKAAGILPAYLIRIFFSNIFMVFGSLIVIFVVVDYISNLKRLGMIAPRQLVLYYWYYLPWFIGIIAPIGFLLSTMFAMGRLSRSSEITAMKAAGISVRRLTIPLLFLGLIISAASFYLGEKVLPEANARRKELVDNLRAQQNAAMRGESPLPRDFHRRFYYFGPQELVYFFEEFQLNPSHTRGALRQRVNGNRIVERIEAERMVFDQGIWRFVKGNVRLCSEEAITVLPFDTLTDSVLTATPDDMVKRIKSIEEMSYWELADAIDKARARGEKVEKYLADLDFKIALPFMNFIVILLGIAITVRAGRKGVTVLFGIGLLLTFTYWILSRVTLALGQDGRLDPLVAAWGGNIIFLILGIILYRRASQ